MLISRRIVGSLVGGGRIYKIFRSLKRFLVILIVMTTIIVFGLLQREQTRKDIAQIYRNETTTFVALYPPTTPLDLRTMDNLMIAIPLLKQKGYSKFTAYALRKVHDNMLRQVHVFYNDNIKVAPKIVQRWYGENIIFHRPQVGTELIQTVIHILKFFKESRFQNLMVLSSDMVLSVNVFGFIIDNIKHTDVLQTYRNNTSCNSMVISLCTEPIPRVIGSVMKKSFVELLLQNLHWLNDGDELDVQINGVNIRTHSPVDSVSARIGHILKDGKCVRYAESRNFNRCMFPEEIQRGIEFYYDKCIPPTIYFNFNSLLQRETFYSKPAVVYSLYGKDTRFTDGGPANCNLMPSIYPEWKMWVYYDDSVPPEIIDTLCKCDIKLVNMTSSGISNGRTWRFLISTEKVFRYVVRDIDSRLSLRERYAVEDWIDSKKHFHVMRDHPAHGNFPMNAGMWGAIYGALKITKQDLLKLPVPPRKIQDQTFLAREVWRPIASKSVLQHDSFPTRWGEVHPFPTERHGYEYVGSIFLRDKLKESKKNNLKEAMEKWEMKLRLRAVRMH